MSCCPERTTCPPDPAVIEWVGANVPVEAVFAVDRWTPYPPQVFMAQQADIFPTLEASFIDEDRLFRDYYRLFGDRMSRHRVQPFFNAVGNAGERAEFVRALGVTHVLVSPNHYDELRPVLDSLSEPVRASVRQRPLGRLRSDSGPIDRPDAAAQRSSVASRRRRRRARSAGDAAVETASPS